MFSKNYEASRLQQIKFLQSVVKVRTISSCWILPNEQFPFGPIQLLGLNKRTLTMQQSNSAPKLEKALKQCWCLPDQSMH